MKYYLSNKNNFFYRYSKNAIALFIATSSIFIVESSIAHNGPSSANVQSKFISAHADRAIKDQYIVVLKNNYMDQELFAMSGQVSTNSADTMGYRRYIVENTAGEMSSSHYVTVKRHYHVALPGFAAQMTEKDMRELLTDNRVAFIEQDQIMKVNMIQSNATWGLDRIDQSNLPLDSFYSSTTDGSGVNAYIIDTGIQISHSDFGGRAKYGWDFVGNDSVASDCNGHGTHIAGTIGSTTYGVAKNATLYAVRVIGCNGSGRTSSIIAGVDWVAQNAVLPAVANMSLGGGASRALDNSVRNAINSGITFAVAAGNSNSDACIGSPNRVAEALTVASSTASDARSSFSDWGTCVDLFAPGSGITSTWNNGHTNRVSGTSMAAPHVAGVAALYLQENPTATPSMVSAALVSNAVSGKISNTRSSPNLLVQSNFSGSTQPQPEPQPNTKFENTTDINIPDYRLNRGFFGFNFGFNRRSTGVTSRIDVPRNGSAGTIEIAVDIKHTDIGNLHVEIFSPDGARATLHSRSGRSTDNLIQVYTLNAGTRPATGTWRLRVRDLARGNTGFIDSWSITFK